MSNPQKLQAAMKYAMANRPKVGGFPFLAECLRQAGALHNLWALPSTQSTYLMVEGAIVNQGTPLITGMAEIPAFNKMDLITALRTDQEGRSTFPEFLLASWKAGVVRYDVDFLAHKVVYFGAHDESYEESYPSVEVGNIPFE